MRLGMSRLVNSAFMAIAISLLVWAAPVTASEALDQPIANGHFYKQANGFGGEGSLGFAIWDVDGGGAFYSKFRQLGGVIAVGYPASRHYEEAGFVYQVTQGSLLQYHPGLKQVFLGNTFEILERAGLNAILASRGIPESITDDGSAGDFQKAKQTRLGWLTNEAIKERYLSAGGENAAIELYGLPMSRPETFGPFITQRFQRIALQYWTEDVPEIGIRKGTVTTVLGGDLLKEFGLIPSEAKQPHSIVDRPTPVGASQEQVTSTPQRQSESWTPTRFGPESDGGIAYDRALYGSWIDADADGQNTREEVLQAESMNGYWFSWYDNQRISEASSLDIDHMVPLQEAHYSGAWAWTSEQRMAYANDLLLPEALTAVSSSSNRSKGARDPAEWKPPAMDAWCQYAQDWIIVKAQYALSFDDSEVLALREMLETCSEDVALPVESERAPIPTNTTPIVPISTPMPSATPPAQTHMYNTCQEAEDTDAPRTQGTNGPGKGFPVAWFANSPKPPRDGDGDGVVCEK